MSDQSQTNSTTDLLSKFKLMVALLSPSSFFAVTLYLPASSTVTFFISSDAKYECPSLSTVSWNIQNHTLIIILSYLLYTIVIQQYYFILITYTYI